MEILNPNFIFSADSILNLSNIFDEYQKKYPKIHSIIRWQWVGIIRRKQKLPSNKRMVTNI
jgi:hypothetical protein